MHSKNNVAAIKKSMKYENLSIDRLQNRFLLEVAAGILIIGIVTSMAALIPFMNALMNAQKNKLIGSVIAEARAVQEHLSVAHAIALQISNRTDSKLLLEQYLDGQTSRQEFLLNTKNVLSDAKSADQSIVSITRFNPFGERLIGTNGEKETLGHLTNVPTQPSGMVVLKQCNIEMCMVFYQPIISKKGETIGTDLIAFSTSQLASLLESFDVPGIEEKLYLRWISANGQSLLFSVNNGNITLQDPKEQSLVETLSSNIEIFESKDKLETIAYTPLEGKPFAIIAIVETKELYAPVEDQLKLISIVIGLLLLIGTGGAYLFLKPLFNRIVLKTKEVEFQEQKFRNLLESAPDAIIIINPEGMIELINVQTENIFGYSRNELVGENVEKLIPQESRSIYLEHRDLYLSAPQYKPMDPEQHFYGLHKNGKIFPIEISLSPIETKEGSLVAAAIRDVSQRKALEKQRDRYQIRLRTTHAEVSLSEERERKRFAAELHDHVVQDLGLIKLSLETLNDFSNTETIREITNTVDHSLNNVRGLMFEISPPILYQLGVIPAVEWLADQFEDDGFTCEVFSFKPVNALESDIEIFIFQSVRELLNNVRKHANATTVEIRFEVDNNKLRIMVHDNGIGFAYEADIEKYYQGTGFGLFSIRDRSDLLGGTFQVISSKNDGTTAIITIPMISSYKKDDTAS